ncbi:MAG TPA: PRC-barrel domain-containing protein [Solirubrobacteraceae bacterium]|nr:PRC-barrel domain-containing protein [Solirubrobacteraceae bacterium]
MSDMFFFHATLEPSGLDDDDGLAGFHVEARDGEVGTIADIRLENGEHYIVLHTGKWILSKNVLLPGDVVERIDLEGRRVYVSASKAEITAAPEFDERRIHDREYLETLGWRYRVGQPETA